MSMKLFAILKWIRGKKCKTPPVKDYEPSEWSETSSTESKYPAYPYYLTQKDHDVKQTKKSGIKSLREAMTIKIIPPVILEEVEPELHEEVVPVIEDTRAIALVNQQLYAELKKERELVAALIKERDYFSKFASDTLPTLDNQLFALAKEQGAAITRIQQESRAKDETMAEMQKTIDSLKIYKDRFEVAKNRSIEWQAAAAIYQEQNHAFKRELETVTAQAEQLRATITEKEEESAKQIKKISSLESKVGKGVDLCQKIFHELEIVHLSRDEDSTKSEPDAIPARKQRRSIGFIPLVLK